MKRKVLLLGIGVTAFAAIFTLGPNWLMSNQKDVDMGDEKMIQTVRILSEKQSTPKINDLIRILENRISARCGVKFIPDSTASLTVELVVEPGIGVEGFRIEEPAPNHIRIIGNDDLGLRYGIGKFLRTSRYLQDRFIPGSWRGTSVPSRKIRGIYFATHFHNFYHDAPIDEIREYLEDLSLWGYNSLNVWFDMHHYQGIDDPEARTMLKRLTLLLKTARESGFNVGFGVLGNESFADSPIELRADQTFPGTRHVRGGYGLELCPSKPAGRDLILKNFRAEFSAFSEVKIDFFWIWPYDQGGCCCEKCRPWGANGFLRIAQEEAAMARTFWPKVKVYISTWLFDCVKPEGEWDGLHKFLEKKPDWVNGIIVDSHTDFPRYPLEHDLPAAYPLLNFPEISMWEMNPWGGYGANPAPERFSRLWNQAKHKLQGGFPYSEGIFEDINKVIVSQLYWGDVPWQETLSEYIAYEFSPDVVEDVIRAIKIMEQNQSRQWMGDSQTQDAYFYMKRAQASLSPKARTSWRWRILFLRSQIERELLANKGNPTEKCHPWFEELTEIYHAQHADATVRPLAP
jgi:hypothetical protein